MIKLLARAGLCYQSGTGIDKNESQAAHWFAAAAAKNSPQAQFNLGTESACVRFARNQASMRYLVRCLKLNRLILRVGCCYRDGCGVKKDAAKAAHWFACAAEKKLAEAQYNLGTSYQCNTPVQSEHLLI
jgi:TPR repeat protein